MPRHDPSRPYTIPGFRISLVREPGVKLAERPSIQSPSEAAPILREYIGELDREVFVVAMLTTRHRLLGLHTVSVGCLTASLVHPRDTFKAAVRESAAAVIFVHNHPSGDIRPSQEDILLTKRLVQAGELLGIRVLDHVIVGNDGHFSFRDNGLINHAS